MIDQPAAVPGFGHRAERHEREQQHRGQRTAGEAVALAKPPQLDPGGHAGERQAEQRVQRPIAMGIDRGLGDSGPRWIGQRPHGAEGQRGEYDER